MRSLSTAYRKKCRRVTKRKINKLFGGPKHGVVISLPTDQIYVEFPEASPPYYLGELPNTDDLLFRTSRYRQRRAIFSDSIVYFWVIESASDSRAFQMLCNYLLRGSEIIE